MTLIRYKITSIALAFLMMGQLANAASLTEVFQQALQSDPTFAAAGDVWRAERENLPIARSFLLPQIILTNAQSLYNVEDNRTKQRHDVSPIVQPDSDFTAGSFKYNSNGYTLDFTQQIFNVGAWASFLEAKSIVKAADAAYAAAAQDLISRVSQAYFNVLLAEDELLYIVAEKKAVYRQLEQVLQQYKVGLLAITGVYQAQAQYDRIVSDEIAAKNDIINAKEDLRAITGVFYKKLDGLRANLPLLKPNPNDVNQWAKTAVQQNWTLQSAIFIAKAAKQNINVQRSGHFPVVNAVAEQTWVRTGTSPAGKVNDKISYGGIAIEMPVFQGWLVTSETKQAKYEHQQTLDKKEETQRAVVNATHQSFNNIINGIGKIKADRRAIVSGESSLRSTIEAYQVGTQTMLDVLQSQTDLFDTFRVFARDQYDYINATIALKYAAGTLNYTDLIEINKWLTKEKSYSTLKADALAKNPLNTSDLPEQDLVGKPGFDINSDTLPDSGEMPLFDYENDFADFDPDKSKDTGDEMTD